MTNLILTTRRPHLSGLQREFNRIMNAFGPMGPAVAFHGGDWVPRADVTSQDGSTVLQLDLPGLTKDNVEIRIHGHVLHIEGERQAPTVAESCTVCSCERNHGRFRRSFSLPNSADLDGVEATFEHGVLTVRVPERAEMKPRTIKIA